MPAGMSATPSPAIPVKMRTPMATVLGTTPIWMMTAIGLNVGEILQQESGSGYFGTPVVIAKRLCDRADAGQILGSYMVSGLLAGRQAFEFRDLGAWELKGITGTIGWPQRWPRMKPKSVSERKPSRVRNTSTTYSSRPGALPQQVGSLESATADHVLQSCPRPMGVPALAANTG
jgi:hypothetical protein